MTYIENVFLCIASPLLIADSMYGKAAEKILSVLPCRDGCLSAFCIHQHLFCRTLQSGHLYHYYRDRPGGGGSDEISAIALLFADI